MSESSSKSRSKLSSKSSSERGAKSGYNRLALGGALLLLATPLALGSLWGLPIGIAITAAIVVRLLDEERYLSANLSGYDEYREKVRYRLLPRVW